MKFVNGWKSRRKQWDKINITLRIGAITIFVFKVDWFDGEVSIGVLNFRIEIGN